VVGGVPCKEVIEGSHVVEVFGDGDAQRAVLRGGETTKPEALVEQVRSTDDHRDEGGVEDVPHAAYETHAHGEEDEADVLPRAGDAAEAHEAEGSGNGDARAHAAVHHRYDHAHDRGEQGERRGKATGVVGAEGVHHRDHETQGERTDDACDELPE